MLDSEEEVRRRNVMLRDRDVRNARKIGLGNISRGIRVALAGYLKEEKREKEARSSVPRACGDEPS